MDREAIKTYWYVFLLIGSMALIASILILRYADEGSALLVVGALLSVVSGLSLVLGLYGSIQQRKPVDERFILHRLKATRFALILGLIAIGAIFFYEAIANDAIRYDLMIVLATVVTGKICGIAYFKLRQ